MEKRRYCASPGKRIGISTRRGEHNNQPGTALGVAELARSCERSNLHGALTYLIKVASEQAENVVVALPSIKFKPCRKLTGTITSNVANRLMISMPEEIFASVPIRVQGKDLLFLGDVMESTSFTDGRWSVHVTVKSK